MKRTALPPRRKPLARSTKPLKRTSLKARAKPPNRRSHATSPIARSGARKSSKPPGRRKTNPEIRAERDAVRAEVFARDSYRCRLEGVKGAGPCFGVLTFHHRRKSGQGGQYTVENGAALCAGHNQRLEADARLAAIAKAMVPPLVLDRFGARVEVFWSHVDKHGPVNSWRPELGPCWLWTASLYASGYGAFHDTAHKAMYAHRFSLSLVEPLRKGREVDHLCRTRACVRPDHLEQVTPDVNRKRQGQAAKVLVKKCQRGHRFTKANTGWQRNGTRYCLTCQRARTAANRLRNKENPDASTSGLRPRGVRPPREGTSRKAPSSAPASATPARHRASPSGGRARAR